MKKSKILLLALVAAAMAHCTANSTLLSDTATALNGSTATTTTVAATTDTVLAKKLRSIWIVGGTKTAGLPAAAVAVGAMASTLDYYDATTNTWSTVDSSTWTGTYLPRIGAAYAGYNGKIYVIGGYGEGAAVATSLATNTVQIYDIATNAWSAGTALGAVVGSPTATQLNGKIYVWSGSSGANASVFTQGLLHSVYNISGNSWGTGTAPAAANGGTEMCMTNDGFNLLKIGGKTAAVTIGVIASYIPIDISGAAFVNGGVTMGAITARTGGTCYYVPSTTTAAARLMYVGGYSAIAINTTPLSPLTTGSATTTLIGSLLSQYTTAPYTAAWSSTPNLPAASANAAGVLQGSNLYYFGGNGFSVAAAGAGNVNWLSSAPLDTVYAAGSDIGFWQNKVPNTTTVIPVMPTARWGHGAVLVQ